LGKKLMRPPHLKKQAALGGIYAIWKKKTKQKGLGLG
jgi:hypothetical protein